MFPISNGMKKLLIIAIVLAVLGGLAYLFSPNSLFSTPDASSTDSAVNSAALTKEYKNDTYGFSLKMPEDFTATEIPDELSGGATLVLQNKSGDGIQIIISPFDEDTGQGYTLTKERILQDIPDMQIQDEQVVEIGPSTGSGQVTYKGIAFLSDDEVFGGESRAVWFIFGGSLYQINTYARLDGLLQNIFSTWNFF